MVVMSYTVVEPRAVMVHLEDAGVANTAVVGTDGLGGDALLADAGHLLQDGVSGGLTRRCGQSHEEVEHNVCQEPVTHTNQHWGRQV